MVRTLQLRSGIGLTSNVSLVGAGGLGTGMDMSGFVDTKWAVEYSPAAALTYK